MGLPLDASLVFLVLVKPSVGGRSWPSYFIDTEGVFAPLLTESPKRY
jgi:hypothetical protein